MFFDVSEKIIKIFSDVNLAILPYINSVYNGFP
jgi:hypothetical protein